MRLFLTLILLTGMASASAPNILWISTEDIGSHLGCYGDPNAKTPTLDRLAAEGARYTHAFTVAPVCAPNRAAVITGMYPWRIGAHHMRSSGEGAKPSEYPALPTDMKLLPQLLREAGYYCTNNSKEDYNFAKPEGVWDESSGKAHWRKRPNPEQPFFAVFNFTGTHESQVRATTEAHARLTEALTDAQRQNPDDIVPPPYHPNTPVVRQQWANYHENITAMDHWAAGLLKELEDEGVADNTIVMFWSDHGAGMPRCKRWPYDSGTRVPLIVRFPEGIREGRPAPGSVEPRLVSSIDLAPTVLKLAGLPLPRMMQGRSFLDDEPWTMVFSGRDRMDERYDLVRSVRDGRYRYVRQFMPWRPYDQFMEYEEQSPIKQELHRLEAAGELTPGTTWVAAKSKPLEELYDLESDPHELNNLADKPEMAERLATMRAAMETWCRESGDMGLIPETELWRLQQKTPRANLRGVLEGLMPGYFQRLWETAAWAARPDESNLEGLAERASDPDLKIRYWSVIGLRDSESLPKLLKDESTLVQVTAASFCLKRDLALEDSLAVVTKALNDESPWIRLLAIQALDESPKYAAQVAGLVEAAQNDQISKYVVRVADHLHAVLMDKQP